MHTDPKGGWGGVEASPINKTPRKANSNTKNKYLFVWSIKSLSW